MKIVAACAAVGVAVGAALLLVLRFAPRQIALDGIGSPVAGLSRGYAQYFPTTSQTSQLGVLATLLVAGLAAGLLLGLLLWFVAARRTAPTGRRAIAAALALSGLVTGTVLAVLLHVDGGRLAGSDDFGWYSYSSLNADGVLYGGVPAPSWWPLLLTGALVGLVVGALAAGTVLGARRRGFRASISPIG